MVIPDRWREFSGNKPRDNRLLSHLRVLFSLLARLRQRTNRKRITFSTWPKPGLSLHYSKPVLSKGTADKYRPQTEAALAPTPRSQSARELSFATREPQQLL